MEMKYFYLVCLIMLIVTAPSCKRGITFEPVEKTWTDTITNYPDTVSYAVKLYNKGIKGNTTFNLVNRVDNSVLALNPQLVIIMIGTNDVGQGISITDYLANLKQLITTIKQANADILLLTIPPRGVREPEKQSEAAKRTNQVINDFNAGVKSLSVTDTCYLFDMNQAFIDAGTPNSTAESLIFNRANNPDKPDGTHPTDAGYVFIAQNLNAYMRARLPLSNYQTVVCFGDSITKGPDDEAKSYPALLENMLTAPTK